MIPENQNSHDSSGAAEPLRASSIFGGKINECWTLGRGGPVDQTNGKRIRPPVETLNAANKPSDHFIVRVDLVIFPNGEPDPRSKLPSEFAGRREVLLTQEYMNLTPVDN